MNSPIRPQPRTIQIDTLNVTDATFTDSPVRVRNPATVPGVTLWGDDGQVELYGANNLRELAAELVRIADRAERAGRAVARG